MEIKKGIAVSPGVSIGKSLIVDSEDYRIPRREIEPSQRVGEIQRVRNAFQDAIEELTSLERGQDEATGGHIKDIFAVHLRFLRDRSLRRRITDMVHTEFVTAEYAVSTVLREIASHFETNVKDTYISERAADIYDIERRLLRRLLGTKREDILHLKEEVIVVARQLSPTQTAGFNRDYVKGIASDAGGRTSHAAIVARSLGIPAVVALEDLTEVVRTNDRVIIDGNRGIVIVNPDEETIHQYEAYSREFVALEHKLDAIREKPATTRDGVRIRLLGNIEFPDESNLVLDKGGEGVGLYRTEFLYLNRPTEPVEQEQYEAYAEVARVFKNKPVVIRTFDLGADKYTQKPAFDPRAEPVPGAALHPVLPAEPHDVQDAAPGDPAGLRSRADQDHVPADHEHPGADAGQDDRPRCDGGLGRREHPLQSQHRDRRDDRDAVGRLDGLDAGPRRGFLQHRHERSDAVHAGGGSRQRAGVAPVLGRRSGRAAADPDDHSGCEQGEDRRLGLRRDGLRAGVCHACCWAWESERCP